MKSISKIDIITINEESRWNKLLLNSINGSYRQSFPFEYAQKLNGRETTSYIFQKDGIDIAGAHYSIKASFKNIIKTADILSGFVFLEEPSKELLAFLIKHFISWAKQEKASYIRINPWFPKTIALEETSYHSLFAKEMNLQGLDIILPGRHTYWIDLTLSEDKLLMNLKAQTRNKIRKGIKSDLIVKKYDQLDSNLIETFWTLYQSLGKLKGFHTLSRSRFNLEIVEVVNRGLANVFMAWYKGRVVNVTVVSNFAQSNYYYGAMDPIFKTLEGCPSPGPFSQWNMIMAMKEKGLKIYDMGFAPGPIPIKNHPRYTIWRYKYDFGGNHVEFLPTYGKALKPIRGRIFQYLRYKK